MNDKEGSKCFFLFFLLTGCATVGFNGSRSGNENQFIIEYDMFNGMDSQVLSINQGEQMAINSLIAMGNTADVFEYGEDKVCKLFREDYSQLAIEREWHNANQIKQLDIAVPGCYGIITNDNRSVLKHKTPRF